MTEGVDHSLRPTGTWSFGRGWYNGGLVDQIRGNIDNVRFSDVALTTNQLIPEPATIARLGLGGLMLRRRRK